MDNDRALADMLAELAASLEWADRDRRGDGAEACPPDGAVGFEEPARRAA